MNFLDLKVNARSEILVIVFQKSRDVLVLQSHVITLCVCVCQAVYNYRFGVGYANWSCSYAV